MRARGAKNPTPWDQVKKGQCPFGGYSRTHRARESSGQLRRVVDFPNGTFDNRINAVEIVIRTRRDDGKIRRFCQGSDHMRMTMAASSVSCGTCWLLGFGRMAFRGMFRRMKDILVSVDSLPPRHQENGDGPEYTGIFEASQHRCWFLFPQAGVLSTAKQDGVCEIRSHSRKLVGLHWRP